VDFILAALGNKPTFAYLQVSVKRYWEQMAWLGPENWGAIPLRVPAPPEEALDLTEGMDEEVEGVAAGECIYNLVHHLSLEYTHIKRCTLLSWNPFSNYCCCTSCSSVH
jgi:hypothetical protein